MRSGGRGHPARSSSPCTEAQEAPGARGSGRGRDGRARAGGALLAFSRQGRARRAPGGFSGRPPVCPPHLRRSPLLSSVGAAGAAGGGRGAAGAGRGPSSFSEMLRRGDEWSLFPPASPSAPLAPLSPTSVPVCRAQPPWPLSSRPECWKGPSSAPPKSPALLLGASLAAVGSEVASWGGRG